MMFPARSPISVVALAGAGGLFAVAVAVWLLPVSLASSGFVLIGRDTLVALMPVLHGHRVLLLGIALVGGVLGLASLWGVPPYPGAGATVLIGVMVESAALLATAPAALLVLGILAVNLAAWLLLVFVALVVLRMFVP